MEYLSIVLASRSSHCTSRSWQTSKRVRPLFSEHLSSTSSLLYAVPESRYRETLPTRFQRSAKNVKKRKALPKPELKFQINMEHISRFEEHAREFLELLKQMVDVKKFSKFGFAKYFEMRSRQCILTPTLCQYHVEAT